MSGYDNLRAYRERLAAENAAREEDVAWFIETGECMTGAATRLGIGADSLERWLERRGLLAEANTLRSRDPIDPTVSLSDRGKAGAAARYGRAS